MQLQGESAKKMLRSRIECFINRLKNSRRVGTRYDQTA